MIVATQADPVIIPLHEFFTVGKTEHNIYPRIIQRLKSGAIVREKSLGGKRCVRSELSVGKRNMPRKPDEPFLIKFKTLFVHHHKFLWYPGLAYGEGKNIIGRYLIVIMNTVV